MWITPTPADISRALTAPEKRAAQSTAVEEGQPDPLPGALADAVQLARGYIAACARNRLGGDGTIPASLLSTVLAIARWELLTRFPDVGLTTDARRAEYDDALARLRDAAAGRLAIEQPPEEPPPTDKLPAPVPVILPRRLHRQPSDAEGL
ncbi:MAG: DUF1320 family protein [Opitutaceae bacterium]|jgi:phage gp36-like protein|nr:DUF1320 family protein [Opitutaceae bacterium]